MIQTSKGLFSPSVMYFAIFPVGDKKKKLKNMEIIRNHPPIYLDMTSVELKGIK